MNEAHEAPKPFAPLQPLHFDDPERLGGFTLLGRLGGGGMGTVFLARSQGGRVVALKTVHEHLAREPEFRMRFRLEAEAARMIGARHGAPVVAADTQGVLPWLATEYLLGPSLAEAVEHHGPLPMPAVRALGARLAGALGDIHGSGVVHRDLKPSNILVTAAGPRVVDFGIARALGAGRLTRTGQAVGTPAYMSPEQAMGRDHEPPGDVFALGGVLVFAATGHGPFPGADNAEVLYRVRCGNPDLSGVPDALLPIVARCLATQPETRPGTAELVGELGAGGADFASALPDPLLADLGRRAAGVWDLRPSRRPAPPAPAALPPAGRPAQGQTRRRLLLAGVGGLLALGAAGSAVRGASGTGGSAPGTPGRAAPSRRPGFAPKQLWTYDAGADATLETVKDGVAVVLVGDGDNTTRSAVGLDVRTGKVVWKHRPSQNLLFAEAGRGIVVRDLSSYADTEPPILALDPATGGLTRFAVRLDRPLLDQSVVMGVTADTLYLWGETDDRFVITAYAASDGKRRWVREAGDLDPRGLASGDLLLVRSSTELVALDKATGRDRWRTRTVRSNLGLERTIHHTSVARGRIHIGAGEVRAVEIATGETLWSFGAHRTTTKVRPTYGTPAVHGDTIYVITRGIEDLDRPNDPFELLALRAADGGLLWSFRVPGKVRQDVPPRILGNTLYVDTGRIPQPLLAVDLTTRRPPWTYHSGLTDDGVLPPWTRTALHLDDGSLFLSCRDRVLKFPTSS
ncbi:PQQ-binding-like beta-propeller repeat protein [Streptomyces sp. NPDC050418]|uniref:serine/threonine-protein kinase n=1 Tax=Streptomyces sp. NPDC050418 TaxID=3365612 RepID=UPI0037A921EE